MATNTSGGTAPVMATVGTPSLWIIGGLGLAIVCGILGSFFDSGDDMQAILYSLTAVGGAVAGFLLALRHVRRGLDLSGGGFAILGATAIAGAVAGFTGPGPESVSGYLAVLHWPALWLVASQNWAPTWSRGAAALSGLLFAVWGYGFTLGDEPADVDSPLVIVAWVAFTIAAIGWVMTLREEGDT